MLPEPDRTRVLMPSGGGPPGMIGYRTTLLGRPLKAHECVRQAGTMLLAKLGARESSLDHCHRPSRTPATPTPRQPPFSRRLPSCDLHFLPASRSPPCLAVGGCLHPCQMFDETVHGFEPALLNPIAIRARGDVSVPEGDLGLLACLLVEGHGQQRFQRPVRAFPAASPGSSRNA
jgi:hypothetical protein